ncbi:MAG: PA2928 family protein [Thermomonas sp.]
MRRILFFVFAMALASSLGACSNSSFDPPRRAGPMGLVDTGSGAQLWLATTQEEERSRHVGGVGRSIGKWINESYTHLRLQAHDPSTAQRTWLKTLLVVKDEGRGTGEGIRILGQQGDRVWLWLHDQLVVLSAKDASVLADLAALERANPGLRGLFPRELAFHAWMGDALVVTLADGRRMRIDAATLAASDYQVADEEVFGNAGFMTTTWNGGYRTGDFGVRSGMFGDRWIGLLGDREGQDAEHDEWGDKYFSTDDLVDEGETARRSFRAATVETREDRHGESFARIASLSPLPGSGTWLQGRMLKAQAVPGTPAWTKRGNLMKATPRPPLQLHDPDGTLVLHRTRLDAAGRLALARVGPDFRALWTSDLPIQELSNRWALPSRLLLYGSWNAGESGYRDTHEALLSLDLATGRWSGWDVEAEKPIVES